MWAIRGKGIICDRCVSGKPSSATACDASWELCGVKSLGERLTCQSITLATCSHPVQWIAKQAEASPMPLSHRARFDGEPPKGMGTHCGWSSGMTECDEGLTSEEPNCCPVSHLHLSDAEGPVEWWTVSDSQVTMRDGQSSTRGRITIGFMGSRSSE